MDWNSYPNFSASEFDCRHTGRNEMQPEFLEKLQLLRNQYARPMFINSGYRDPSHPVEAPKAQPGVHTLGLAADIAVDRNDAYKLLKVALQLGFLGIGVQQKGGGRFIHLDMAPPTDFLRPTIWSY